MSRPTDPAAVVDEALGSLLLALPPDVRPHTASRGLGNVRVTLTIERVGGQTPARDTLGDRDRAILDITQRLIAEAGRRVHGSEIRLALRAARRGWGDAVTIRVLANLVAAGHLVNDYDGEGYDLPPHVRAA